MIVRRARTVVLIILASFMAACGMHTKTGILESDEAGRALVEKRREFPIILVHRGAWAVAPENTLEAYAAAMELGADGCEIDIRQTADGVLMLFHDDYLSGKTDRYGEFGELTQEEARRLRFRSQYGLGKNGAAPPTLDSVFEFAREKSMLLHLDIKVPGIEEEIESMLEQHDLWDNVVYINDNNSASLRQNPRYRPVQYTANLYDDRRDTDPESVRKELKRPDAMVIVDDPRLAALIAGRSFPNLLQLPDTMNQQKPSVTSGQSKKTSVFCEDTEALLRNSLGTPDGLRTLEWVNNRAGLIQDYASCEGADPALLFELFRDRTYSSDWRIHSVDGVAAIRSLALLNPPGIDSFLIEKLSSIDPRLETVYVEPFDKYPVSHVDWRLNESLVKVLGQVRTRAAKAALLDYLNAPENEAFERGWVYKQSATDALLKHRLTAGELEKLLTHPKGVVRGTAILHILDYGTPAEQDLLARHHPWTLKVPSLQKWN